jgi:hypothetical protein
MFQSTKRKPMGKTYTLVYINKKLAKGACQQKEEKNIYIYTFSTNLILILIPILTSPKTQTLIF